jgi:hypothetical protein
MSCKEQSDVFVLKFFSWVLMDAQLYNFAWLQALVWSNEHEESELYYDLWVRISVLVAAPEISDDVFWINKEGYCLVPRPSRDALYVLDKLQRKLVNVRNVLDLKHACLSSTFSFLL